MEMRLHRAKKRLTLREAANRVGVSHSTLQRYETEPAKTPLGVATALAELYGTTVENFLHEGY